MCRDCLGRNPTDRGRKALKVSLLTTDRGTPLCSVFHKANKNDCKTLEHLLKTGFRKSNISKDYAALLTDKGYDSEFNNLHKISSEKSYSKKRYQGH